MEALWSAKQSWLCTLLSSSIPENTAGEHRPAWPWHRAAWGGGVLSNSTGEVRRSRRVLFLLATTNIVFTYPRQEQLSPWSA